MELHRASRAQQRNHEGNVLNTSKDVVPSYVLGKNLAGTAADKTVNFFSGGIFSREGKPLTEHNLVAGLASVAQIPWKIVAYQYGISKEALGSLIMAGWSIEQATHYLLELASDEDPALHSVPREPRKRRARR